ncbi:MAG: hypothetical protein ACK4JD_13500 [Thermoflexales bacterium]
MAQQTSPDTRKSLEPVTSASAPTVSPQPDTITISRVNAGWPTAFSWTSQTIARGGVRQLNVAVTAPPGANPGDVDVATIRAAGSGGYAEVTLTTHVPYRAYLPSVTRGGS